MDGQQDPQPVEAIWKLDTVAPKTFLDVHPTDPSPFSSATFEVRPLANTGRMRNRERARMGADGGCMSVMAGWNQ